MKTLSLPNNLNYENIDHALPNNLNYENLVVFSTMGEPSDKPFGITILGILSRLSISRCLWILTCCKTPKKITKDSEVQTGLV